MALVDGVTPLDAANLPHKSGADTLTGEYTFTKAQHWAKGANVASAATLTPGTDGNYFHVTGTTTVSAIASRPAGSLLLLEFDGVVTLTYNAASLILLDGLSVQTVAGDVIGFVSEGGGNWREIPLRRRPAATSGLALRQTFRGLSGRTHPDNDLAANQVWFDIDEVVMDDGISALDWRTLIADLSKTGYGSAKGFLDTGSRVASTGYEVWGVRASQNPGPPPAPSVATGAAGNVNAGLHSWKVTFVSPAGETSGGTTSTPLNLASALQVNLTSVPIGPPETTQRKVYRTIAGDTGSHKLVGTIGDNTTTSFTDNVADGSLGADVPIVNTFGPSKMIILHRAKDYFTDSGQGFTTADDAVRNLRLLTATATDKLAQGFKTPTAGAPGKVEELEVKLLRSGAVSGNIWFTVESDAAGNPSGTVLATSDKIDASKIPTTATLLTLLFRLPFTTADTTTQYHVVLQGDYTRSDTVVISWRGVAAGGYTNGVAKEFNGTTWANASGVGDFIFKVYTTRNDLPVTMPSGYDQKCLILPWAFNNSGNTLDGFLVQDRFIKSLLGSNSGNITSTIPLLSDWSTFIPPRPVRVSLEVLHSVAGGIAVAAGVPDGFGTTAAIGSMGGVSTVAVVVGSSGLVGLVETEFQRLYFLTDVGTRIFVHKGFWW